MPLVRNELMQYISADSKLLVGGTKTYYEADANGELTVLKTIYSDPAMTVALPSSTTKLTNLGKEPDSVYIEYPYGVVIRDRNGKVIDTIGWVDGAGSSQTSSSLTVESIAALRLIEGQQDGDSVYVVSYHSGDGTNGGGRFVWYESESSADNSGTIISPATAPANGRWLRCVETYLTPLMFGASPTNTAIDSSVAFAACSSATSDARYNRDIYIPTGSYQIAGDVVCGGIFDIILGDNVRFFTNSSPANPYTVVLSPSAIKGGAPKQMVDYGKIQLVCAPTGVGESTVYLEWFGDKAANLDPDILNFAFSNSSGNLDYVVGTEWNIGSTVTATGIDLRFVDSGRFVITNSILNVNGLKNERGDGEPCVTGTFGIGNGGARNYDSDVFLYTDGTSNNASVLGEVQDFITSRNGNAGILNWVKGDYVITGSTFSNSDRERIHYTYQPGCIITPDSAFYVSSHTNVDFTVFNRNMTGYVHFYQDTDLRMFGLTPNNASGSAFAANNSVALVKAMESLNKSNLTGSANSENVYLIGGNQEYYFTSAVTYISSVSTAVSIKFKDAHFLAISGFASTFAFIYSDVPMEFRNCTISSPYLRSGDLTTGVTIVSSLSYLKIYGCKLIGSTTVDNMSSVTFTGSGIIKDSEISGVIIANDSNDVYIQDNVITQLAFTATTADFVVNNVLVTRNKFYGSTSKDVGIYYSTIGGGSIKDFGHDNCSVDENIFINDGSGGVIPASTCLKMTYGFITGSSINVDIDRGQKFIFRKLDGVFKKGNIGYTAISSENSYVSGIRTSFLDSDDTFFVQADSVTNSPAYIYLLIDVAVNDYFYSNDYAE